MQMERKLQQDQDRIIRSKGTELRKIIKLMLTIYKNDLAAKPLQATESDKDLKAKFGKQVGIRHKSDSSEEHSSYLGFSRKTTPQHSLESSTSPFQKKTRQ